MAELFAVDRTSVTRHIRNIYKSQELDEKSTCAKNAQVRFEGKRQIVRDIPYYNLDMIISVGYREQQECDLFSPLGNLYLETIHHQGLCHQPEALRQLQ